MEIGKLPMAIVGITIAVIVCAVVLIPVVQESTQAYDSYENTGYFYLDKLESTDTTDHTLVWDSTTPAILKIDDVDLNVSTWGLTSFQAVTIFASETDLLRLGAGSGGASIVWIQIRGSTISYAQASSSLNATIGGGDVTAFLDSSETPKTLEYTTAYLISPTTADYVMKKSNESSYMLKDSPVYSLGYTSINAGGGTNDQCVFLVTGTMEDFDVTIVRNSGGDITFSNKVITKTAVSDHKDLYEFEKYSFTATENDATTDCVYSYVIVPTSITAERSVHPDATTTQLINVIPILVIIGIVMLAVGTMIYYRR